MEYLAAAANLPVLRSGEWEDDLDHEWHELYGFSETDAPAGDPHDRDILVLLAPLHAGAESTL